jgi:hypothetical protein
MVFCDALVARDQAGMLVNVNGRIDFLLAFLKYRTIIQSPQEDAYVLGSSDHGALISHLDVLLYADVIATHKAIQVYLLEGTKSMV